MKNILFIYLKAFSITGGIEKFNKAFMKALKDITADENFTFLSCSPYDLKPDTRYIDEKNYKGYNGKRLKFILNVLSIAWKYDTVFVGHINLAPVALMMKFLNPKIKLVLTAHGIEVWNKVNLLKRLLLKKTALILAVSNYTKQKIVEVHHIAENKIMVFPNTIDPYFKIPQIKAKPEYLLDRYNLSGETKIILTITRINKHEGYKGYDKVLEALPAIIRKIPDVKYILGGQCGQFEAARLNKLVNDAKLEKNVIMPGFIEEEELTDHYLLADVFILPSKKEGFGIVFIEAAVCGTPVIAGNKDGSVDALLNGRLGKLIDPDNIDSIEKSISDTIANPISNNRDLLYANFNYEQFRNRLRGILIGC